jgi:flagellar hook assembly protein FlgD
VGPGVAPAAGFGFVTVGPVPSRAAVRFACRVPEAGDVSLEIFDPAGRRVREVSNGAREPGIFQVAWDGAAEDGRRVAPGVYLARLAMAGRSAVRRVTITR